MKPLFISALYHPDMIGGAEKVAQIVAEGMRDAGHDPVVATTSAQPGVRVDVVNGVKVYYIGLKNIYWPHDRKSRPAAVKPVWHIIDRHNPWMAHAIGSILDRERPDVVNTHSLTGFSCAVWPAIQRRRVPLVHTLHDYSLLCPKTSMFRNGANCGTQCTACKLYSVPSRYHSACVDAVVGVSRHTLERHLAQGFFRQSGIRRVIYNGLAEAPRPPVAPARREQPLRLGYVGQLIPSKGIAQLVRVMQAWPSSQCSLTVAGRGSAEFEQLLRREAPANVSFVG
ncbi:MAG TPA: glycosyltransferase, partial [Ramlibacter sp.]|nr:glycosyltransferase [Ramlibacter sp.]